MVLLRDKPDILPYRLEPGDPIRLTGTRLVKGKRVKLQAQSLEFLEVSDPKAVCVLALATSPHHFLTCLRPQARVVHAQLQMSDPGRPSHHLVQLDRLRVPRRGDSASRAGHLVYGHGSRGVLLFAVPLVWCSSCASAVVQVDFDTPKGYVEPRAPSPKAAETMASKLNIDVNSTAPSRAGSVSDVGGDAEAAFEAFVGSGRTLNGRRTKGKGLARKIEQVDEGSKIIRTECVCLLLLLCPATALIALTSQQTTDNPDFGALHSGRSSPGRAQPSARQALLRLDVQAVRPRRRYRWKLLSTRAPLSR